MPNDELLEFRDWAVQENGTIAAAWLREVGPVAVAFAALKSAQAVKAERERIVRMIHEMPTDESGTDEEGHYAQGCINTRRAIIEKLEATNDK